MRRGALGDADAVALVIDASGSMAGTDGDESRLGRAKVAAKRLLAGLSGTERAGHRGSEGARAATGVEHDPDRLARVVDAITARAEGADSNAAVLLAEERLAALPGAHRVVVITDVDGAVPERTHLPLEVVRVGAPADNVALTRFELRRTPDPRGPA